MRTFRERRESKKVENYPEARSKRRLEFKRAISQELFFSGRAAKKKRAGKNLTSAEKRE